jgi:predicted outer membrane repeat protein
MSFPRRSTAKSHTQQIGQWLLATTIGLCVGISATTTSAQVVTGSIADQRLHFVSTGHVYYAETPQAPGQPIGEGALLLRAANGRPLIATAWQRGLPLLEQAGSSVVAIKTGALIRIVRPTFSRPRSATAPVFASLTLHEVDAGTGRITRTRVFTRRQLASIWQIESEAGVDLNADGVLGSRIYVDAAATGENTGQSWPDALTNLHDALDLASQGMEIWIAQGTYKPSRLPRLAALLGITDVPKLQMFELKSGVALYGGFAGGETQLDQRDVDANPTILSGDHLGNDEWPPTLENQTLYHDNAYSVVLAYQLRPAARLDGLVITGGNAYALSDRELFPSTAQGLPLGDDNRYGGGVFALSSDLVIANCTLKRNMALYGGGLAAFAGRLPMTSQSGKVLWLRARPGSRLAVTDTLFEENLVPDYSFTQLVYGSAGAVFIADNYIADFRNVEFIGNSASNGGAIKLVRGYSSPRSQAAPIARFVSCVFYQNTAICSPSPAAIDPVKYAGMVYLEDGAGGALYADGGARFDIARCLFLENRAVNVHGYVAPSGLEGGYGGAIALDATSKGRVATTVFSRNTGEQNGGAINVANWDGYPRGTALEVYFSTFHANTGTHTAGISHYGRAVVRGYANIFYENINSFGNAADLGNLWPSTSAFSNSLFTSTADGDLSGNVGPGNVFRTAGESIFVDPSNPAGPDGQWGTADDGYRLSAMARAPVFQVRPPDFADADGNGNFREPLPLDAKGDRFGAGPVDRGAYQTP